VTANWFAAGTLCTRLRSARMGSTWLAARSTVACTSGRSRSDRTAPAPHPFSRFSLAAHRFLPCSPPSTRAKSPRVSRTHTLHQLRLLLFFPCLRLALPLRRTVRYSRRTRDRAASSRSHGARWATAWPPVSATAPSPLSTSAPKDGGGRRLPPHCFRCLAERWPWFSQSHTHG